jgi:hypothetical protein
VQLALATGIPFSQWEREDDATVATALALLDERAEE